MCFYSFIQKKKTSKSSIAQILFSFLGIKVYDIFGNISKRAILRAGCSVEEGEGRGQEKPLKHEDDAENWRASRLYNF